MSDGPSPTEIARDLATRGRRASAILATASTETKNGALEAMARHLEEREEAILAANARDLAAAQEVGLSSALTDRLRLDGPRIEAMVRGVRQVIALPDPVGQRELMAPRPNGLQIARVRIPLGVICIIYESRPNVTVDAGALCIKSGNTPILKGGREAFHSNGALVTAMRAGLAEAGLPADSIGAVATSDRAVIGALIRADEHVDLVIPRGGEGLIRYVTENATVPVIQHYKGVCHVYVHGAADLAMACEIAMNAKTQRPGVCNAMETLLVDQSVAATLLPDLLNRFARAGVQVRADARARSVWPDAQAATQADWDEEYLDLIVSVAVVDGLDGALDHIARHGSGHTECIVTQDEGAAARFLAQANASCVLHNASTRFNDGFELGLGAEIGISTSRLHAYGPMGLEELTTRKFVVIGTGQIRS
jgi:glutamate-5-semialdehyde dehydrogenase